jgi:DNA polymerase
VDARELLRRYLEQRRELGESEFVLDQMTVADAMAALGVRAGAEPAPRAPAPAPAADARPPVAPRETRAPEREIVEGPSDWREALRAAEAAEGSASRRTPPPAPISAEGPIGAVLAGPLGTIGTLEEIARLVTDCTRCPLYSTATNPVPGEGNPNADMMIVGEAPGANEDETGRPFVGAAGQLLTKILAAIKLQREDVFIANVLKHRPPGNRNPKPEEVVACSPYLVRQIELVRPKVILALGTFAAQTLLDSTLALGKLRGQVHRYHGVPLIVTYHPAALLRNPAWKRPTWEDVQLARRILDSAVSGA